MTSLQFSKSAVEDLKRLREFIATHDPNAAERFSLRIRQAIGKLVNFPALGRPVQDLEKVREFVAGNYVVRYLHGEDEDGVVILRIWHGREHRGQD